MRLSPGIIIVAALALAGCSGGGLRELSRASAGPDEFLILPNKPLTPPPDSNSLPTPTPGGANLVDQYPIADAAAALGGRPDLYADNGVSTSDGVLVAQASRYGVPANTRVTLAEEDAQFRKRKAILSKFRLFKVDRYEQSYSSQTIDPFHQAGRFQNAGIRIPTVPPKKN
ncbi:MAG: DUF3035 domain-containing protein [Rhodobacteraceae bacterium]|nr:DUF3035 domain-containing protein [Paracoccaceae bacterium]